MERGGGGSSDCTVNNQLYEVVEQKGELPIFVVNLESNAKGRSRLLHGNLLLSSYFLPPYNPESIKPVAQQQERKSKEEV